MNVATPLETGGGRHKDQGLGDDREIPVPAVVVRDVLARARARSHVIVFGNEKGGVGKSTLAFHTSIALCSSGARVLAVDLDRRQKSLTHSLEVRAGTASALKLELPSPRHLVLARQSGAMLDQEMLRMGGNADFVVIDLPGADSAIARYAMAIADTLVTPVGNSSYDLSVLGRINPVNRKLTAQGHFGELVSQLRTERLRTGLPPLDWLVLKNRTRAADRRLDVLAEESIDQMAEAMEFRTGVGLTERLGFRDLLAYGLTYLDLGRIPGLGRRRLDIEENIIRLLLLLQLPGFETKARPERIRTRSKAAMAPGAAAAYVDSIHAHMLNPG